MTWKKGHYISAIRPNKMCLFPQTRFEKIFLAGGFVFVLFVCEYLILWFVQKDDNATTRTKLRNCYRCLTVWKLLKNCQEGQQIDYLLLIPPFFLNSSDFLQYFFDLKKTKKNKKQRFVSKFRKKTNLSTLKNNIIGGSGETNNFVCLA